MAPRSIATALLLLAVSGCGGAALSSSAKSGNGLAMLDVTVASSNGRHLFHAEQAKSAAEQEKGLMYRTGLADDYAMLFWPYPAGGGPPKAANFWMENTPSPLDILFIRADGTVARIAENAVPMSQTYLPSGEPVGAVLEIRGGRALELGIDEGDRVTWQ